MYMHMLFIGTCTYFIILKYIKCLLLINFNLRIPKYIWCHFHIFHLFKYHSTNQKLDDPRETEIE